MKKISKHHISKKWDKMDQQLIKASDTNAMIGVTGAYNVKMAKFTWCPYSYCIITRSP